MNNPKSSPWGCLKTNFKDIGTNNLSDKLKKKYMDELYAKQFTCGLLLFLFNITNKP